MIFCLCHMPILFSASHRPQDFLKSTSGSPDEGRMIVQHYCANCHAIKPLISLGAPRIGQSRDWASRTKQGLDALFQHTNEGLNAMPSRGGCFECSDQQLMRAIFFMLPKNHHHHHPLSQPGSR